MNYAKKLDYGKKNIVHSQNIVKVVEYNITQLLSILGLNLIIKGRKSISEKRRKW